MPTWAWIAAGWFGGRALLVQQRGVPLGDAVSIAIGNPTAGVDELVAVYTTQKLIEATNAVIGAAGGFGSFASGNCPAAKWGGFC